jgi:hypothetical protein
MTSVPFMLMKSWSLKEGSILTSAIGGHQGGINVASLATGGSSSQGLAEGGGGGRGCFFSDSNGSVPGYRTKTSFDVFLERCMRPSDVCVLGELRRQHYELRDEGMRVFALEGPAEPQQNANTGSQEQNSKSQSLAERNSTDSYVSLFHNPHSIAASLTHPRFQDIFLQNFHFREINRHKLSAGNYVN